MMNRPRLIRGLRIAWSVWWGILCVLLVESDTDRRGQMKRAHGRTGAIDDATPGRSNVGVWCPCCRH
jgi:hypothetical protein